VLETISTAVAPPVGGVEFWFWLVVVGVVGTFGGGTVGAIYKARSDTKLGVAAHEKATTDALGERWEKLIRTQTEAVVAPLRESLAEAKTEIAKVKAEAEEEIAKLKAEQAELNRKFEALRTKYWSAISYIRTLLLWITRHIGDVEDTEIPKAPPVIMEDV